MTLKTIKTGAQPNDGTGDNLRSGAQIINENFAELDQRAARASAQLSSIETGATKNRPDAELLARANHTGAQPASTISDFSPAVKTILQQYGLAEKIRDIPEGQLNGLSVNTFTFCRPAGAGILPSQVNHYVIHLQLNDAGFAMQIAVNFLSGKSYSRIKDNGNWQAQWVAGIAKGDYGVGAKDDAPFVGVNQNPDTYLTGGYAVGQFTILGTSLTGVLITQAGSNATAASQQFVDWASGKMYSRGKSSNAWSPWRSLLAAGDFGVGATDPLDITNTDTLAGGTYRVKDITPGGPGIWGSLYNYPHNSSSFTQLVVSISDDSVWSRRKLNGQTFSWVRQTPEFIANANGTAVKYADGTMICYFAAPTKDVTNRAIGSIFASDQRSFTFPIQFVFEPIVVWSAGSSSNGICWGSCDWSSVSQTNGRLNSSYSTIDGYLRYIAIGRWK